MNFSEILEKRRAVNYFAPDHDVDQELLKKLLSRPATLLQATICNHGSSKLSAIWNGADSSGTGF